MSSFNIGISFILVDFKFNFRGIIDFVFRKLHPLDMKKLKKSKTECLISATNYETGNTKYFSNKDDVDFYEVLRATKALPLFFNRLVRIGKDKFCDSNLSASIEMHIAEAIRRGATKILVIDNSSVGRLQPLLHSIWASLRKKKFKKTYFKQLSMINKLKIPKGIQIIKFKPEFLPLSALSIKKQLLEKAFDKGYEDALKKIGLREFLK